jgi:hypothetical protein
VISARKWQGNILNAGALCTVVTAVLERDYVITQDNVDKDAKIIPYHFLNIIGLGTGLLEGCEVSVGSTTQQYSVTDGWAVINNSYLFPLLPDTKLQYIPAVTDATDPHTTTAPFTALTVGSGGVINTDTSIPENGDQRDKVLLGILNHQDGTQITHERTATDADLSFDALQDLDQAMGFLPEIGSEFKITPYASSDIRLKISDGSFYSLGINGKATVANRKEPSIKPLSGKNPMTLIYLFRDGLGGFLTWSTTTPQVAGEAPQHWDDGTVVTPGNPPNGSVTSNQWTDQRHFKDGTFDQEIALFSQVAGYGTKTTTLTQRIVETIITAPFIKFFIPVAERIIQNNVAYDASNTAMAVTVPLNRFGAPTVI